jgi:hypothetical protein
VALLDHDTFDVVGAWEADRGDQFFGYDVWWHLNHDTVITSEWATPSMFENGLSPEDLLPRSSSAASWPASYIPPRPASRSAAGRRWWRSAATASAST